jgi:hypothetical protein
MITQFGYITIWSLVWPLAPIFALINNYVELRADAVKICKHVRRPVGDRVESIGSWLETLVCPLPSFLVSSIALSSSYCLCPLGPSCVSPATTPLVHLRAYPLIPSLCSDQGSLRAEHHLVDWSHHKRRPHIPIPTNSRIGCSLPNSEPKRPPIRRNIPSSNHHQLLHHPLHPSNHLTYLDPTRSSRFSSISWILDPKMGS